MKQQERRAARGGFFGVTVLALCLCGVGVQAAEPGKSTTPLPAGHPPPANTAPATTPKRIDINRASRAELKTLPGIGNVEADKIIANRPFLTKVDLVTLKILPEGVYVSIKDRIVAGQSGKPLQKK